MIDTTETPRHGDVTKRFFSYVGAKVKAQILTKIAEHYGISVSEAEDEVSGPEAEHLLDYIPGGGTRTAASLLFKRHGLV